MRFPANTMMQRLALSMSILGGITSLPRSANAQVTDISSLQRVPTINGSVEFQAPDGLRVTYLPSGAGLPARLTIMNLDKGVHCQMNDGKPFAVRETTGQRLPAEPFRELMRDMATTPADQLSQNFQQAVSRAVRACLAISPAQ